MRVIVPGLVALLLPSFAWGADPWEQAGSSEAGGAGSEPGILDGPEEDESGAIVNGALVTGGEHYNVVALALEDGWGGLAIFCTGSLIQTDWVLTAAHCLEDLDYYLSFGADFFVLFGENIERDGPDFTYAVTNYHPHPDYNGNLFLNDIGLVQLGTDISFVPLMALNTDVPVGSWLGESHTFIGFGDTTDAGSGSGVKRQTDIPLMDWDTQYIYSYAPNTNVCHGDSGGAAIRDSADGPEQVGVNAFVTPDCEGGSNGATRVDRHIDWIVSHVPDAILNPADVPDPDPNPGGDTGTDPNDGEGSGGNQVPEDELPAIERANGVEGFGGAWEDPLRPDKKTYPLGVRCSVGSGPASTAVVLLAGLVAAARRRW